jgi:homoserine dehydrogenase
MSRKKKIGLFGFGVVGKGFYELLKCAHVPVEIVAVCVREITAERQQHELYFTTDHHEILQNDDIDIVVELISDSVVARSIVDTALRSGKAVISANKKMIAESLEEVDLWHQFYPSPFLYEGAVGGGIPIIYNLNTTFRDQHVSKIKGILNGTSNYILTQMHERGWSFEDALRDAQAKGFAELNPALDVDGHDPSFKLAILGYHAFGEVLSLNGCYLESLRNVTAADIRKAKSTGRKIKSIATLERVGEHFICSVKPEFVAPSDLFYSVDNENNIIGVQTDISGWHYLIGKGAGAYPSGSAVLADLKKVLRGFRYQVARRSACIVG